MIYSLIRFRTKILSLIYLIYFFCVQLIWFLFRFYNIIIKHTITINYTIVGNFLCSWILIVTMIFSMATIRLVLVNSGTLVKVQSHYSVCIAYANLRKRMQMSENFSNAQYLTPPLVYRPLQTYD